MKDNIGLVNNYIKGYNNIYGYNYIMGTITYNVYGNDQRHKNMDYMLYLLYKNFVNVYAHTMPISRPIYY